MNKAKAIAKLTKIGAQVSELNQAVYAKINNRIIYVGVNPDGECHSFGLVLGQDNIQQTTDISWRDNLTRVIKAALR